MFGQIKMFHSIQIENKSYPTIIMGEDHFGGWFSKSGADYYDEEMRAMSYFDSISIAYQNGVRGFSVSPYKTIMKVLSDFKLQHPDIVCIANPHYKKNYYIGTESLWTSENLGRLTSTIFQHLDDPETKKLFWFKDVASFVPFSESEIKSFRLDEVEYANNLAEFSGFCDFSLIGNLHRSVLLLLGRQDLVKKESELVRQSKMIPILMCEAAAAALGKSKDIDCAGYWIYMNEDFGFPNIDKLITYLKNINKPVTAYKAFTRKDGFNIEKTLNFFKNIPSIKSLVVGIENPVQAEETFGKILNSVNILK